MNLDGQRFGSLTVEHITDQRTSYGSLLYLCRCDCGNTRLATAANLKRGEITRCETCQGKSHMKDLTGQRFGKLVAIKPAEPPTAKRTTYKWLCVCDCGNVATVSVNALTTGKTKSCGCAQADIKSLYVGGTAPCKLNEKENPRKTNTSGRTGVWFDQSKQLWCAELMFRGKKHFLGRYALFEDAVKAREKAEEKYFEKFLAKQSKKQSTKQKTNESLPDAKIARYVGKTLGGLKVLGLIEKQPRFASKFLCECVACGKIIVRKEGTLRKPPSSCGCLKKSSPKDGSRTLIRTCQICGKTFSTYTTQDKKFCSRECFEQSRSNHQTNEKLWRIKSPEGEIYEFENLYKWARKNYKLIEPETADIERTVRNFANGIYNVKRGIERPNEKFKSKSYQYKGWTIIQDDERTETI